MKSQSCLFVVAAIGGVMFLTASEAWAQEPSLRPRIELVDNPTPGSGIMSPSDLNRHKPTVRELRQERALFQMRQSIARTEANAWMGYSPSRPFVSGAGSYSYYAPPTRIYYVPYYVR